MSEEHHHGDFKFFLGFFIGGIIGAVIIFFLGTKEGKKTGKLLEEKGKNLLEDVQEKVSEFEKKGKEIKEEVVKSTGENLEHALAKIEELQENSLQTTADLRKRLFKNLPKKK